MYRLNRIADITSRSLKETDYRTSVYLDILTEETAQVNSWFQFQEDTGSTASTS
ncbi:hypothetical protein D3C73_1645170 [compost metagenome]